MHPPQRRDPDRLLPADPRTRDIARDLYLRVANAPVVSPHGHVPVEWLAEGQRFRDPADLLVTYDHYVTRLLHAGGVDLEQLGVAGGADPRAVWRLLAEKWHLFAGTASGYWLEEALSSVLGVDRELSPANADAIYDQISGRLAESDFTPRALFERFGIEVLATTDDPFAELAQHDALRDSGLRVVPTFRPDKYLDPDAGGFAENVDRLLAVAGQPATFAGYLAALEGRRRHFIDHGAVSADHGVEDPLALDLPPDDAQRLFAEVIAGTAGADGRRAFRAHMLFQMARMSVDDGLVMTVHAGVLRNHHTETFERFGPDTGHDIPVRTDFVRGLRPLLQRFGNADGFHLVLFAVDETVYSRELAPLAAFYRSVYIGAPWWFLDAPDAIGRFRSAVTETAGFYRGSGFIDDTRAFLSIPARHDTARRADAAFLARYVAEGRIALGVAERIADDLVGPLPKRVFKL
ncbi:glucuronate isomerase [Leifsonia sp. 98AMF]|uniref:glucuronate isomerase n=1 Tax=unclassified Leifsonia TaxID=2663824 RepID=UPI000879B43B|nr:MULTISPECIES: glucuronate isomerase [unclassified Leifsonia]SDH60916.1 glucuronate isomerase [Leifsonia sp. 197AMF]SDI78222.1 glucuronate isomerase [Leifsonia sp. 466MF]SDK08182.1 glucuronate isomerase [Leifsonia sp. 157MF]SDN81679.1 glucuronate isomerase [Leifsonia sp. 509MF]SEN25674.1 glucuronate isomerase [Leifsonia sp. 467MF]